MLSAGTEHMPPTRISSQSPTASDLTPRCQLQWRLACFGLAITALFLIGLPTKGAAQAAIGTANSASSLGVSSQVGQPAPEFSVTTLDGQPLTSADLLAQEKPFILYFFATW